MSLRLKRSAWFLADLEHYAAWYDREANWDLAERHLRAVASTLAKIAEMPTLGHSTAFTVPELAGLKCLRAERPFQEHLIFYRHDQTTVYAERAVHGALDLPRRLMQPPGSTDD
jgi:plasmid stabilization system protein ParE